jgi:ubiquitin carboxyl-terminal hydrolase 7
MLRAFGWGGEMRNQQQDVSEFWLIFSDLLEKALKETQSDGIFQKLFSGSMLSVVECQNIDFKSERKEEFSVL